MPSSKIKKPKADDDRSVHLEIIQHPGGDSWGSSMFQPQREPSEHTPSGSNNNDSAVPAPEKKLTLFALRLAVLEKTASGLGMLGFIWATVVLLGGFAVTLRVKDFWFVTVIILIEGTRIFSRSHELEWQHHATSWSLNSVGRNSFRAVISKSRSLVRILRAVFCRWSIVQSDNRRIADELNIATTNSNTHKRVLQYKTQRTWGSSEVPIFPFVGWVFISKNVGRMLYWLQILSALACTALSLMRLIQQGYGDVSDEDTKNRKSALNIFYGLALAEALVFLVERTYWTWKIEHDKLMDRVCRECELGHYGMASIKRFFYDSYSRCIEGSIFDGLKMDLLSFASDLLLSDSRNEQLNGARILNKFSTSNRFSADTLRKIGSSTPVIERLIEMLNWKNPDEEEIRKSAAEIVSKLAGRKQNAIRVAGIPGSMETISSLLYTGRCYDTKPHGIGERSVVADQTDYEFSAFNLLGLLILKKLANDHDNCWKMGNARGLIPKIIDFTSASESLLRNATAPESQIKIVKRSLQLVKILGSTTGRTGAMLRKQISDIVFVVSNVRGILQFGESHMVLQKLGIEILTSLAMDDVARGKIGATGGVIRLLVSIFFQTRLTEDQNSVSVEAGEALAVLALDNDDNCRQILKVGEVVERLIGLLEDPVLQVNSSRILTKLCAHSQPECALHLKELKAAAPAVLKAIMVGKDKLLEVSVGLAAQILRFTTFEEYAFELRRASIGEDDFAKRLVEILGKHNYPEIKVPQIRRFVIEVAIQLMKSQQSYIQLFKNFEAEEALKSVAETTSELECFNIFSGIVGQSQNNTTVSFLVDKALELMA